MFKYIVIVFLSLSSLTAAGQVKQLSDLENCINKSTTHVSDSLVTAGWKLDAALTGSYEDDHYRTFSFGTSKTDHKKAVAWIRIHNAGTPVNRVYYQVPDHESFLRFVEEIKGKALSKTVPQDVGGQSLSSYIGPKYAYQVVVADGSYTIVVISKKFFEEHSDST